MTAGVLFVWINAILTLLAGRVARRLLPRADLPLLVLGALVAFVALADLCLVQLDVAGMLAPLPLAILVTILFGIERSLPSRGGKPLSAPTASSLALRTVLGLAAGLFLWWCVQLVGRGVGYVWDDLSYHAAIPAWWMRTGSLDVPPLTYQAYYAANAELTALWFLLPLGTDTFANLGVFLWLSMIVAAFAVITRNLDNSPRVAAAALCCFLVSSEVRFFVGTFSANDLAITGLGCATLALAWTRSGEGVVRQAFLCGVAAGLALGTKVSMAPLVLLTGVIWLVRARRSGGSARALGAYTAGLLLFGSYCYARNLALTGNPLFPAAIGPFEGPFDQLAQRKTSLIPSIVEGASSFAFWKEFLRLRLDWPLPLGLASLGGFVACAWAAVRERDRDRQAYRLLLLASAAAFLLLFPFQPFSGTNNRPDSGLNHLIRYLTFPFALGLILLASRNRPRRVLDPLLASAALLAAALSLTGFGPSGLIWIVGGAVAAAFLLGIPWPRFPRPGRAALLLVPLAWTGAALLGPTKARAAREHLLAFGGTRPLAAGWESLELLPRDARVAMLSNLPSSHTLYRPLFGADFRLQPVPVHWDGSGRGPLHETWREKPDGWWWEFDAIESSLTYSRLLANLTDAGVEYLLLSKWPLKREKNREPAWPVAKKLLGEHLDSERRLFAGSYAELWDVRDLRASEKTETSREREQRRRGG